MGTFFFFAPLLLFSHFSFSWRASQSRVCQQKNRHNVLRCVQVRKRKKKTKLKELILVKGGERKKTQKKKRKPKAIWGAFGFLFKIIFLVLNKINGRNRRDRNVTNLTFGPGLRNHVLFSENCIAAVRGCDSWKRKKKKKISVCSSRTTTLCALARVFAIGAVSA